MKSSLHFLIFLNNFSGLTYIKMFSSKLFESSSWLIYYGIIKVLAIMTVAVLLLNNKHRKKFYRPEMYKIQHFSQFTKEVFDAAVRFFHTCAFCLLILQLIYRKRTNRFLRNLVAFHLTKDSRNKLLRACVTNSLFNFGFLMTITAVKNMVILKTEHVLSFVIWFTTFQSHLITIASLNFFRIFHQFTIIALREVRIDFESREIYKNKFQNGIKKFYAIEWIFGKFSINFDLQLTLVMVYLVITNVAYVS